MTPYDSGFDGAGYTGLEHETTGALVGELLGEAKQLVREEVRLAKAELKADAREAGAGAGFLGAAAFVANGAFLCFVAMLVFALAYVLPIWLAAGLVGFGLMGVAGLLAAIGSSRFSRIGMEETIETVREDGQWASETMHAARSQRHGTA